ncbi:MAG: GAF domain-containing protein [Paenibacillaceae bacterium]|nr:GAF domain-containing protein [Paenibacillaceae bacterium]
MEKSLLGLIGGYTNHLARIISDTLDTDILIIDTNMNIVGSSFKYLNLYTDIRIGTIISTILIENRNVIVEDKTRLAGCRKCDQYRECKMSSFVGVPIRVDNQAVGALALILTRHRAKFLFESLDSTVSFLENFAELISGKIENETRTIRLENRLKEIEAIIDKMFEAVIYTDYFGNIIHVNKRFCDVIHLDKDMLGSNMKELFPFQLIEDYFKNHEDISNERLTFEMKGHLFHGVVSSKKIYLSDSEFGTLFYFKPQSDFVKRINISEQGSLVTFDWLKKYFSAQELQMAREMAKTNHNLLIQSSDNELNLLLAKAVFNTSERNLHDLYVVYSDNLYRDLFEIYMMDEYGVLKNADGCTVVIVQPEKMPLYIQHYIADFMKYGKFKTHDKSVRSNVRFLFCVDRELESLVEQQLFSPELYRLIARYKISFEGMEKDMVKFRGYVTSGLNYYRRLYDNKGVELSAELFTYLRNHFTEIGKHSMEIILERIAAEFSGRVTVEGLRDKNLLPENDPGYSGLEEMSKEQIKTMLERGYSKTDIADILGISRSTLYRKIREIETV